MRRIILAVGLLMLLVPLAAWCEEAPATAPTDPTAACAPATPPALSAQAPQSQIGPPALRFLSSCTCTSARSECKQDCLGQGCLGIIFTCYTPDPCLSDCSCTRCIA